MRKIRMMKWERWLGAKERTPPDHKDTMNNARGALSVGRSALPTRSTDQPAIFIMTSVLRNEIQRCLAARFQAPR